MCSGALLSALAMDMRQLPYNLCSTEVGWEGERDTDASAPDNLAKVEELQ